jgi:hypothetical protein
VKDKKQLENVEYFSYFSSLKTLDATSTHEGQQIELKFKQ